MPYANVNGIRIYYEDHETGMPLLMLHGYVGTTRMWDQQVKAFSGYRFIVYDMRGHGQTEVPDNPSKYSIDIVVEDQYQLLNHIGVVKGVMGGLSLGGFVTLKFFEAHPEMCTGLILCDTGPGYRTPQKAADWNRNRIETAEIFETGGIDAFLKSPRSASDYYTPADLMRKHDPKGLAMVARHVMTNPSAIHVLDRIDIPTLIVVGDGDDPFLFSCEYIHKHVRNSEFVIIENAGHGCNIDQPQQFNKTILDFLERMNS